MCSDNNCPCPQTIIGRNRGYIAIVKYSKDYIKGIVCCEQAARLRKLDLRSAHKDMLQWWHTGTIPNRESLINLDANQESISPDVFLDYTRQENNRYLKYIQEYIKANKNNPAGEYKVVFDTETSDLPRSRNVCIIQIAWLVVNKNNEIISREKFLFKPTSIISPEAETIHGISQHFAETNGVDKTPILKNFLTLLLGATEIIGHNVSFDLRMLSLEVDRNLGYSYEESVGYKDALQLKSKVCTMRASAEFCQIYLENGTLKFPKLSELHEKIFGSGFSNAHDALTDVEITFKCYNALKFKSII